jgi:hypothetical protein
MFALLVALATIAPTTATGKAATLRCRATAWPMSPGNFWYCDDSGQATYRESMDTGDQTRGYMTDEAANRNASVGDSIEVIGVTVHQKDASILWNDDRANVIWVWQQVGPETYELQTG